MKRKSINLPVPSLIIREISLFLSLLYLYAQINPNLLELVGLICVIGLVKMMIPVIVDKEYSIHYKLFVFCILLVVLLLIIYGTFFSANYASLNDVISVVGLGLACGGVVVAGLVSLHFAKRESSIDNEKEIAQRFIDVLHVLVLYAVILINL